MLLLACATTAAAGCAEPSSSRSTATKSSLGGCERCNVILVSLDTLGARQLGTYGQKRPTSPNIDAWARRGVNFTNAMAPTHWTLPSHGAMFTGRQPHELRLWKAGSRLAPAERTLAEALLGDGYRTHMLSNGLFVHPLWGLDQGHETFDGSIEEQTWNDAMQIFPDATRWALKHHEADAPFLLTVRSFHPHDEYAPSREALDAIGARSDPMEPVRIKIDELGRLSVRDTSPERAARIQRAHQGEVWEVDRALGTMLRTLEQEGVLEDTIVIITADHGEGFGEHGLFGHLTLHHYNLHVPLIILAPGLERRRLDDVVELRSIPSTILDLLGSDARMPGTSLLPRIRDPRPTPEPRGLISVGMTMLPKEQLNSVGRRFASQRDTMMQQFGSVLEADAVKRRGDDARAALAKIVSADPTRLREQLPPAIYAALPKPDLGPVDMHRGNQFSAFDGRWQLIVSRRNSFELYDVVRDPDEQRNLLAGAAGERPSAAVLARLLDAVECSLLPSMQQQITRWASSGSLGRPLGQPGVSGNTPLTCSQNGPGK